MFAFTLLVASLLCLAFDTTKLFGLVGMAYCFMCIRRCLSRFSFWEASACFSFTINKENIP